MKKPLTKFHVYLLSLDKAERQAFADRCNSTVGHLMQIAYGNRIPRSVLTIAIERESKGVIRCEDVNPDADWSYLRKGIAA